MNKKTTSNVLFVSMSIALSSFLLGCGGGGGGSSDTTPVAPVAPSTYSITGTVPGTIIEAYCSDGTSYSTTSTNNGTTAHPFTLTLPSNLECKLVMITNETATNPADYIITPIEFESNSILGTYIKMDKNINLGNIPLDIPGVNSAWIPGVRTPLKVTINNQILTVRNLSSDPMDTDNDGILNVYENDDGDSLPNKYDDDSDNSGKKDSLENKPDSDHDGINDIYDNDDDNDGISDNNDKENNTNDNDKSNNNSNSSTIVLPTQFNIDNGRLLGSQCAQCHGTNGISSSDIDSIKGEDNLTHEIYDDDPLMNAQAKGYTSTEIIAIESWLKNIQ
jgi:hypothetical protein